MKIVISSGHGLKVRGASGYLDEVDEARRVVDRVAEVLKSAGVGVQTFHDNTSTTQDQNLKTIVNYHNAQTRDLDVSVHFNCYDGSAHGTECLYITQQSLAADVATSITEAAGVTNRGPKKRTDLYFLNNTEEPAVLIETVFCDSKVDAEAYTLHFDEICHAIAQSISGLEIDVPDVPDPPPAPDDGDDPLLALGSSGDDVVTVQTILGIPDDGVFGPVTDGAVRGYQSAVGIASDGVVGPDTWDALDELEKRKQQHRDRLPDELINAITQIAEGSAIARYNWRDRGKAPIGYTAGVACAFAVALMGLDEDDPAAEAMAQADRNKPDTDALSFYRTKFEALGMSNSIPGADTLRHLFVMMLGLGMRESSGRYCEGRDTSATNTTSDTAEAGLFQTSWNISTCSEHIPPLLDDYWDNPNGLLDTFGAGVEPDSNDLPNFGSGDGARYQFLSKYAPSFHAYVTGIGMRYLRQHWGPINRSEVELKEDADAMLAQVQAVVEAGPPPEPTPDVPTITITINPPGSARVIVTGAKQ